MICKDSFDNGLYHVLRSKKTFHLEYFFYINICYFLRVYLLVIYSKSLANILDVVKIIKRVIYYLHTSKMVATFTDKTK